MTAAIENSLQPAIRAQAYGFLASAFRQPDPAWAELMASEEVWAAWPELLAAADPELGAALRDARAALASPGFADEAAESYIDIFGHTLRGRCPAHELEFGLGEIFQKSADLADISGFYSAFGVEVDEAEHERADHICVECEFMLLLTLKEDCADRRADEEGLAIIRSAERRFLEGHLGAWLPAFAARVEEAAGGGFYADAACFARLFLAREAQSLDAACGPRLMELRPTHVEAETSIDCMTAENCGSCPLETLMPATFARKDDE